MAIMFETHSLEFMTVEEGNRLILGALEELGILEPDVAAELLAIVGEDYFTPELWAILGELPHYLGGPSFIIAESWEELEELGYLGDLD